MLFADAAKGVDTPAVVVAAATAAAAELVAVRRSVHNDSLISMIVFLDGNQGIVTKSMAEHLMRYRATVAVAARTTQA